MIFKSILTTAAAAALLVTPVSRASADAGDFVAGAIVGAIVNHAARNQPQRTTRTRTRTVRAARPSIPSTQEGRQIQSSLNYFGFNAGTVDGQLGGRSRSAISTYQAYLGYPATGQLTPFEQTLLIDSYNRAQAGGMATKSRIASTPDGTRGLLKVFRAEMAGQQMAPQMAGQPVMPGQGGVTTVTVPAAVAATTVTVASTAAEAPEPESPATGLPNLFGGTSSKASLASHCNTVSLLTNTNGGFTTVSTMSDPNVALNEQFCLARTYAIAKGEEMTRTLGATPEQITANCSAYGAQMKPHVAALSVKGRDEVVRDVSGFVLASGVPTPDLAATAKVCLSEGYRTDDMNVALGSALILVTLGEKGYGELLGHHLSQGFGAAQRVDLALPWYETGMMATTPVFAPGQPERSDLIRAAATGLSAPADAALPMEVKPQAASLPSFAISQ